MQIELSNELYDMLAHKATVAGYESVPAFVEALAKEPTHDPRGDLTEQQLAESVVRLRAAEAAIDAGQGIDGEEAMRRIGKKHGFLSDR